MEGGTDSASTPRNPDAWVPVAAAEVATVGEDDAEEKEHASDLGLDFHPIIFDHGIT